MYTGNECIGCIGIFATFPLIHPDQVYPNSTNIRSIGMVVKDQVIKWDHLTGYMTLKGTETLFTSRTCCHETHNYVVCTCNTLQPFSPNDSKLISVESLHGHSNAIQVSHTQWCRDAIHSAVHTLYSRSHHLSLAPSPSHLELTKNPCNVMYAQKTNCTCLISFEMSQCAW